MAYFYLYRAKLKHKSLLKIGVDRDKKLEERSALLAQTKAREVEYLNKFKADVSELENVKKSAEALKVTVESLQQERYFLLQELIANASERPRTSSATFVSQDDGLEVEVDKLKEENLDLRNQIEELTRRAQFSEEEDMKKLAEIKALKKQIQKVQVEKEEMSPIHTQLDMTLTMDQNKTQDYIQENEQ